MAFDQLDSQLLPSSALAVNTLVNLITHPRLTVEDALRVLIGHTVARQTGGRFILHLDDTDPEAVEGSGPDEIFNLISWLDLSPDEFRDFGQSAPYSVSARRNIVCHNQQVDVYKEAVRYLIEEEAAYFCFCPTTPTGSNPPFYNHALPHECRSLSFEQVTERLTAKHDHLIRFRVQHDRVIHFIDPVYGEQFVDNQDIEDFVLLTRHGYPMPYLSHVVDNHFMQVTLQVRRSSELATVPQEILLNDALGWDMPTLLHVPPVYDPAAKSVFDETCIEGFMRRGYSPQVVLNYLTHLLWEHPQGKLVYPHQDFQAGFDIHCMMPQRINLSAELLDRIQEGYTMNKV